MGHQNWYLLGLAAYVSAFTVAVALFTLWRRKRSRRRAPMAFKLLRSPGETLRRRMAADDETDVFRISAAALAPVVATLPVMALIGHFKPTTWTQLSAWLAAILVVFGVVVWFCFRWAVRYTWRYGDNRLGYLGERAVGDALTPLARAGYRVFHDIPATRDGKDFNIDHVAVGPAGVFAIETKTRRKGSPRPGVEDHKVAYDGKRLIWPWGQETLCLEQTENRARWVSEWLNRATGCAVVAQPVLALPGWYVVQKALGPVRVVNHNMLEATIRRLPQSVLSEEQVDLISRQLDERCRDVED